MLKRATLDYLELLVKNGNTISLMYYGVTSFVIFASHDDW